VFSWRNRFLTGHSMSIVLTVVAYHMSGWRGVGVFLVTALLSKSVLELINYIQHYGLVRVEGTPIAMHHCWNSNKRVSTYLLCNATRHSSHHIDPYQPFWLLRPMPEAPTLPLGYFTSIFVALVPPVWHRMMAVRLLKWDHEFATPEERAIAQRHNERSGVRCLQAAAS
jgi:alkane 1-monooxygenase